MNNNSVFLSSNVGHNFPKHKLMPILDLDVLHEMLILINENGDFLILKVGVLLGEGCIVIAILSIIAFHRTQLSFVRSNNLQTLEII